MQELWGLFWAGAVDEAVSAAWGQGVLPALQQGSRAASRAAGQLGRALAMRAHPKTQVSLLLVAKAKHPEAS